MKKLLELILKLFAKLVIKKYQPQVIGITGSVGKTSTKEAIFAVLNNNFHVRRNVKNYNNEIGLPLTILGRRSAGKNIFIWLAIFIHGLKLLLNKDKNYPEVLILEMAVDRPNDMDYLLSIVPPTIAVITTIGSSHMEHFVDLESIIKEKAKILQPLTKNNYAVLNQDDEEVIKLINQCNCQVRSYGASKESSVQISRVNLIEQDRQYGTSFRLTYQNKSQEIFLPSILGKQHAVAIASAVTVGLILNLELSDIVAQIKNYQPALGRTNLIKGIKDSWIIDDTYNSSPQSAQVALEILQKLPTKGEKLAVLGDMLELGNITETAHQDLGKLIVKLKIDYLYLVGERSRDIARGAKAAGMLEDKIYHFPFTEEAGLFLQDRVKTGDLVLVKGSRGMKMEKIVYEIMAKPWEADELLVDSVR